jgi:hypothetical protein
MLATHSPALLKAGQGYLETVLVFQSHPCLVLDRAPSSVTLKASPIGLASVCTELFLVLEGQNEGI